MSLAPPPPTVKFGRPSPTTASSSSSPHCLIPVKNSNSLSIGSRVPKEAIGIKRLQSDLPLSSLVLRPQALDASSSFSTGSPSLATSVGTSPSVPPLRWNLGRRHMYLLNVSACLAAISTSWLFFSAIPALLAFKKAAESLEKLLDVTAEELPGTMAAIRLSGMEISDLTMELSDLGQEITQGVRSSTRAVRIAEDRLRHLTTMSPTVPAQGQTIRKDEKEGPVIAKAVRNLREGIMKGRVIFGVIFSITQISRWAFNFLTSRGQKRLTESKQ